MRRFLISMLFAACPPCAQMPTVNGGAQQSWTGVWIWVADRDVPPPNTLPG